VTGRKLRTADYPDHARQRLGSAVADAREALGFKFRPPFAKHAKIALRSLVDLENGKPGVGEANLKAVARALPNWTDDTPRIILEDGPIPSNDDIAAEAAEPRKPVLSDAEIAAMDRIAVRKHYFFLENEYGEEAADDWLVHAARVRRDARRAGENRTTPTASNLDY
jgi:hypothetical protein